MEKKLEEKYENRFVEIAHSLDSNMDCIEDSLILGTAIGMARAELLLKETVESIDEVDEAFDKCLPEAVKTTFFDEIDAINSAFTIGRWLDKPEKFYYNLKEATKYYYIAANAGHSKACFNLALNYFTGMKDEKHDFEIGKNYSRAAGLFYFAVLFPSYPEEKSKQLYYLAKMFFYGYGIRQDFSMVPKLSLKSHEYNSPLPFSGKLDNLALAAMNIMDGKYDGVSDELLEEIDLDFPSEDLNDAQRAVLYSRQARLEILLRRRRERASNSYHEACPCCGSPLVVRTAKDSGVHRYPIFLGCTAYPACEGTKNIFPDN